MVAFNKIQKSSSHFPSRLLALSDCPELIYLAGEIIPADNLALAIVGTRKISSYGKEVVRDMVLAIAPFGVTIVSGLMYGVDMEAHLAALEFKTRTLGVLGFGINYIHKVPNAQIIERIVEGKRGAVLSDFAPEEEPAYWTFPKRNRIIAGLANAVLVIEAAEKSGTFYTVEAALQQGKDILAVPGSIYSSVSTGCHKLIDDGAKIVKSAQDVIDALNLKDTSVKIPEQNYSLSKTEESVFKSLDQIGISVDDLVLSVKLEPSKVLACLVSLEIKGLVKDLGRGVYKRV